ncbi:MAG: hypothetical protein HOQ24_10275 [Mycobacteriaceae bacterium]|nr:hypothetical protein [Mycobacteriaceae bacterium]
MTSPAVSLGDVVQELGIPAVRERIRVLAAGGEHARAAVVSAELRTWLREAQRDLRRSWLRRAAGAVGRCVRRRSVFTG